jgi:hypothetical protein
MIPAATYVFKHALVRDAAYESLLKRRRQELRERTSHAKGRQCAAPTHNGLARLILRTR